MKVRVYTNYSPVRILRGVLKKQFKEPTDALAAKCGLTGPFVEMDELELPSDRTYRGAWKPESGKIKIDSVKAEAIDAEREQIIVNELVEAKKEELAIAALKADGIINENGTLSKG